MCLGNEGLNQSQRDHKNKASLQREAFLCPLGSNEGMGTGIELVKQALEHSHEVTVMVRDPKRLPTFSKEISESGG